MFSFGRGLHLLVRSLLSIPFQRCTRYIVLRPPLSKVLFHPLVELGNLLLHFADLFVALFRVHRDEFGDFRQRLGEERLILWMSLPHSVFLDIGVDSGDLVWHHHIQHVFSLRYLFLVHDANFLEQFGGLFDDRLLLGIGFSFSPSFTRFRFALRRVHVD